MRKAAIFGIIILTLLPFTLRGTGAQNVPSIGGLSLTCRSFTMKGEWVRHSGLDIAVEGECSAVLINPTNTSVKYDYTYWKTLGFTPKGVDFGRYFIELLRAWVEPEGTLRYNLSMRGEFKGVTAFAKLVMSRRVLISGKGEVEAVDKRDRITLLPFSVNVAVPVRIEWGSVLLVISALLVFFLWFVLGFSMAVATRREEAKVTGWSVLASYGIIAIPFTGLIMTLNMETQFFALVSMEFLWLGIWLSTANRTTPEKPGSFTKLLGNAVLLLLGLSVLAAISGGYVEGNPEVTGGIIFLIVLLLGASHYILNGILGKDEKTGRIPRIETFPLGIALLLSAYPVLVVFILAGWRTGFLEALFTTALLFAVGLRLTRKAEKSRKTGLQSV